MANDRIQKLVITGLGTGMLPVAPGTWGSAAVAGLFLLAAWLSGGNFRAVQVVLVLLAAVCSVACVATGPAAERLYGKKDPRACTIDEFAGQAVALLFLPLGTDPAMQSTNWLVAAGVGFFYFRVMDILKPPPVRMLEPLPAGWGVLLDDLAAGVYANLAAQVSLRWCYFGCLLCA